MEKAIKSTSFAVLKELLEKAYRGVLTEEMSEYLIKYSEDACDKMKRIIDALN